MLLFNRRRAVAGVAAQSAFRYWAFFPLRSNNQYNESYLAGAKFYTNPNALVDVKDGATVQVGVPVDPNIIDDLSSTYWRELEFAPGTHYVGVDFGEGNAHEITAVELLAPNAGSIAGRVLGLEWEMRASDDGLAWATQWNFNHMQTWGASGREIFKSSKGVTGYTAPAAAGHRYWRVTNMSNSNTYWSIRQLEFRDAIGGAQRAVGGTPLSNGGTPANAFDGNDVTSWGGFGHSVGDYIGYDFGAGVLIKQVWIKSHHYQWRTHEFDLEFSDDGVSWTTAWRNLGKHWAYETTANIDHLATPWWGWRPDLLV